jgi:hypothetical protein
MPYFRVVSRDGGEAPGFYEAPSGLGAIDCHLEALGYNRLEIRQMRDPRFFSTELVPFRATRVIA